MASRGCCRAVEDECDGDAQSFAARKRAGLGVHLHIFTVREGVGGERRGRVVAENRGKLKGLNERSWQEQLKRRKSKVSAGQGQTDGRVALRLEN